MLFFYYFPPQYYTVTRQETIIFTPKIPQLPQKPPQHQRMMMGHSQILTLIQKIETNSLFSARFMLWMIQIWLRLNRVSHRCKNRVVAIGASARHCLPCHCIVLRGEIIKKQRLMWIKLPEMTLSINNTIRHKAIFF